MIGLSGKCPGKKLSFIVTFFMATAETPGLYSITLSTRRNGNLNDNPTKRNESNRKKKQSKDASTHTKKKAQFHF
jgi:hypothetical protein